MSKSLIPGSPEPAFSAVFCFAKDVADSYYQAAACWIIS
jgi:hypothetical protein